MARTESGSLGAIVGALAGRAIAPIAAALQPWLERASAWYSALETREKLLVRIAAVVIAAFVVYDLIYLPIRNLRGGLEDRIQARQADVARVRRLAVTYSALSREVASLQKQTVSAGRNFSLFSVIEQVLAGSVGRDKIASITPGANHPISPALTQYNVELKLSNLNLDQIVDALYRIGKLPVPVIVSHLHIKRRMTNTHAYDVEMTCVAIGRTH